MIKFANSRNIIASVILLFISIVGQAQVIQTNTKNNNVDYNRLARIDGLVNEYISKNWLTGAVSIVIR